MKIARLHISNIVGIESLAIEAGQINVIKGQNGAGKTSVLRSIKAALGGGDQGDLVRNGAEQGEVVLIFDSGDKLRTVIPREGRTRRDGEHADGSPLKRPMDWVKARLEAMTFNPVAFLTASPAERIKWLLTIAPLELAAEEMVKAVGHAGAVPSPVEVSDGRIIDPLATLARLRTKLYDERTGINRIVTDRQTTIKSLEETVATSGSLEDQTATIAAKRRELEDRSAAAADARRAIDQKETDELLRFNAELNEKIRSIQEEAQRQIDVAREAHRLQVGELTGKAERARAKKSEEATSKREPLVAEIAKLEEAQKRFSTDSHTRKQIERFTIDFAEAKRQAEQLTGAILNLDRLRTQLLEKLPIRGLVIQDGKLFYNSVDFETLNEANQVKVACLLAKEAAGDLGLVCVEGITRTLDDKRVAQFMKWARTTDLQFFITEVAPDGTPLTIETQGEIPVHAAE